MNNERGLLHDKRKNSSFFIWRRERWEVAVAVKMNFHISWGSDLCLLSNSWNFLPPYPPLRLYKKPSFNTECSWPRATSKTVIVIAFMGYIFEWLTCPEEKSYVKLSSSMKSFSKVITAKEILWWKLRTLFFFRKGTFYPYCTKNIVQLAII